MLMLDILFSLVWVVVLFFAIRFAGQRFFHENYRADIAAIAVALAFVVGALWHPFSYNNANTTAAGPVVATLCYRSSENSPQEKVALDLRQAAGGDYVGSLDSLSPEPDGAQPSVFNVDCNIYANGWAAHMSTRNPASGIVLVIDSRRVVNATQVYREARPDVAKALGSATALNTGFSEAPIPTSGLAAGPHTIQLGALSSDGKSYYLIGTPTTVTLR